MIPSRPLRWLPILAITLAACADAGPVATQGDLDLDVGEPLAAVLPDLAPEPGTVGTDRYVPTLERVLRRSVRVIGEKRGEEAARKVIAQARDLHDQVREAREAQEPAALGEAVRRLETYSSRVGLRVFGAGLVRHVAGDAGRTLERVSEALRTMQASGQDVQRLADAARTARRHLAAAQEASDAGRPVGALVHAAHALDLAARIAAAF